MSHVENAAVIASEAKQSRLSSETGAGRFAGRVSSGRIADSDKARQVWIASLRSQ
jgi:hypothetical protein